MAEKNNFFITYTGNLEFVGNKTEGKSKAGKEYWTRSCGVNLNDTNPQYPVVLVFDLFGEKMSKLDGFSKGEEVMVTFTINSKSYVNGEGVTKYFPSFNLINIEKSGMNQDNGAVNLNDDPGDLPF